MQHQSKRFVGIKWRSGRKAIKVHGNNRTKENWYSKTGRGKNRKRDVRI
jgi:hypothetical protein